MESVMKWENEYQTINIQNHLHPFFNFNFYCKQFYLFSEVENTMIKDVFSMICCLCACVYVCVLLMTKYNLRREKCFHWVPVSFPLTTKWISNDTKAIFNLQAVIWNLKQNKNSYRLTISTLWSFPPVLLIFRKLIKS